MKEQDQEPQDAPSPCESCFRAERCAEHPVDCYRFEYWAETGKAA
jgi:hypothetical protein